MGSLNIKMVPMPKDMEKAYGWLKSCIWDPILKDLKRYTGNPGYDFYVHIEVYSTLLC